MRDVTYIKLVIFGKKPDTTFADANNDGKISMLDIGQTKLIILGKEKELTLVDWADRIVTIPRPVERVVPLMPCITRLVIGLGATDKIVGMDLWSFRWVKGDSSGGFGSRWDEMVAGLAELPNVGSFYEPNQELILSLKPDVVIPYAGEGSEEFWDRFQKGTGIPVVCYRGTGTQEAMSEMFEHIKFEGKVLGKEKEAEEIVSYFTEELKKVTEVTSPIDECEKPRVYFARSSVIEKAATGYDPIELAGGILVSKALEKIDSPELVPEVSIEQIILWNPDIFLISRTSVTPKLTVESVLSDPRLQTINAVKNRKVYYTPNAYNLLGPDPPRVVTEVFYLAKLFHPGKFEDLDLEKEGNELFERFYGVDGLWTEIGGNLGFI
jgi:iron complex transport system substrate-binding protein